MGGERDGGISCTGRIMNDDPDLWRRVINRVISFCSPIFGEVGKAQEWLLTGTGTVPSVLALAFTVDGYAVGPDETASITSHIRARR